ncbi:MAG: hypothetical protein AAF687_01285 [Pseudomonadota bacterium]
MKTIEIGIAVHKAIENARRSFDQTEDEILQDLLSAPRQESSQGSADPSSESVASLIEAPIAVGSRSTGNWSTKVGRRLFAAQNLREAYITAINALHEADSSFLSKFSEEGNDRRRFVAREPEALYPHSRHLAQPHRNNWHRIDDWYVDLNVSRDQVAKRIRRAATLTGRRYGSNVVIKDGFAQI